MKILRIAQAPDVPFSAEQLEDIRSRALTSSNITSFGPLATTASADYAADVSVLVQPPDEPFTIDIAGDAGRGPVTVPLLNFGALGFGPMSERAIRAIAVAAARVNCLQNTGEDGLTTIHRQGSAGLIWQIGTGYWGCRDERGLFDPTAFARAAANKNVKMIEVKLSQGAKPGQGGFLPAAKNTKRVGRILGVAPGTDIISPPQHSAFSSIAEMLKFVQTLRELAGGKPVGIKVCIGSERAMDELVLEMIQTRQTPSFITIDGGDGGTGAAPSEVQNHAGLPSPKGLLLAHQMLKDAGLREQIALFGAGRIANGFDLFKLLCLGADACFVSRAAMVAMGCVQAKVCHTGKCPSGLTTHQWWRQRAISPSVQGAQLASYYETVREGYLQLLQASGRARASELDESAIIRLTPPTRSGRGIETVSDVSDLALRPTRRKEAG